MHSFFISHTITTIHQWKWWFICMRYQIYLTKIGRRWSIFEFSATRYIKKLCQIGIKFTEILEKIKNLLSYIFINMLHLQGCLLVVWFIKFISSWYHCSLTWVLPLYFIFGWSIFTRSNRWTGTKGRSLTKLNYSVIPEMILLHHWEIQSIIQEPLFRILYDNIIL